MTLGELRSLFVGLRPTLTAELEAALGDVRRELSEGIKPKLVKPRNYHLTVAFMGLPARDVAESSFSRCVAALDDMEPFEVSFDAVSGFGSRRHPARVVFAEPSPSAELDRVGAAFRELADRDPVFHLTLARTRTARDGRWVEQHLFGERALGRATVGGVALMANDGSGTYVDLLARTFGG
jgi:2'-5' RNA ligase